MQISNKYVEEAHVTIRHGNASKKMSYHFTIEEGQLLKDIRFAEEAEKKPLYTVSGDVTNVVTVEKSRKRLFI